MARAKKKNVYDEQKEAYHSNDPQAYGRCATATSSNRDLQGHNIKLLRNRGAVFLFKKYFKSFQTLNQVLLTHPRHSRLSSRFAD
jgi:hypothetical protein